MKYLYLVRGTCHATLKEMAYALAAGLPFQHTRAISHRDYLDNKVLAAIDGGNPNAVLEEIRSSHDKCCAATQDLLDDASTDCVIVYNSLSKFTHVRPYFEMAKKRKVGIRVVECPLPIDTDSIPYSALNWRGSSLSNYLGLLAA